MQRTMIVVACSLLVAFVVPSSSSAPLGNSTTCDDVAAETYGYADDGDCTTITFFDFDVTHSEGSCDGYCLAVAHGVDDATWEEAYRTIYCPEGGSVVVDWTTESTLLAEGSCEVYQDGDIGAFDWYAFGYSEGGMSFTHGDNQADVLMAHLI